MQAIINRKKYTVTRNLNDMEYSFIFKDSKGIAHLVDGYDVQEWCNGEFKGIETAIEYAKEVARMSDNGVFWWTISSTK